jgi:hypothetical protein
MSEATTVAVLDPANAEEENLPLVVLTPGDMPEQQRKLTAWCAGKIERVERELATFVALEDEAVTGGFKSASYRAAINRTKKRIVYYQKIKAAFQRRWVRPAIIYSTPEIVADTPEGQS